MRGMPPFHSVPRSRNPIRRTAAALLLSSLLLPPHSAHAADVVVVTAARMIDVIAGRVVPDPQITITDGRITAVETRGAPVAADARRIDLPDLTLLPGLIDMHVHLTADPRLDSGYRGYP